MRTHTRTQQSAAGAPGWQGQLFPGLRPDIVQLGHLISRALGSGLRGALGLFSGKPNFQDRGSLPSQTGSGWALGLEALLPNLT